MPPASFKTTWLRAVTDPDSELTRSAVMVALVLSIYANRSGVCFPSVDTIAANARYSRSVIHEALSELELRQFILRASGTYGRPNRYTLVLPPGA